MEPRIAATVQPQATTLESMAVAMRSMTFGQPLTHALEGRLTQRRVQVEARVFEVQTRARVLWLETPGDGRVERAGREAITQETLRFDRDDFARLLPPRPHIESEPMADDGPYIACGPPFRMDAWIGGDYLPDLRRWMIDELRQSNYAWLNHYFFSFRVSSRAFSRSRQ